MAFPLHQIKDHVDKHSNANTAEEEDDEEDANSLPLRNEICVRRVHTFPVDSARAIPQTIIVDGLDLISHFGAKKR